MRRFLLKISLTSHHRMNRSEIHLVSRACSITQNVSGVGSFEEDWQKVFDDQQMADNVSIVMLTPLESENTFDESEFETDL